MISSLYSLITETVAFAVEYIDFQHLTQLALSISLSVFVSSSLSLNF